MKALVNTKPGAGNLVLQDVAQPAPRDDEVLIKIHAAGVCGTDVHIMHGSYRTTTPVIIGHEFSGEIVATGRLVTRWKRGDRVVVENTTGACGICRLCRTGKPHICEQKRAYGTDSDGALAEFAVFPEGALHRIPDSVSYEEAALTEPLVVVIHALLERGNIAPESSVVILGAGTIGLLAVQVCRAAGANQILLAGTSKDASSRFALGTRLGASRTINVESENLRDIVSDATDGQGVDVVIEASGSTRAASDAIHLARRAGQVIAIGLTGAPVTIDWDAAVFKEIDLVFSKSSTYMSWVRALLMIESGRVMTRDLISHRFPLDEWQKALHAVESGDAVKAIVLPDGRNPR